MSIVQLEQSYESCIIAAETLKKLKGGLSYVADPKEGDIHVNTVGDWFIYHNGEWMPYSSLDNVVVTTSVASTGGVYDNASNYSIFWGLTNSNVNNYQWLGVPFTYYGNHSPISYPNSDPTTVYDKLNAVIGGLGIAQGTMVEMHNLEESLGRNSFVKGTKVAGSVMFGVQSALSLTELAVAYKNGDPDFTQKAMQELT